VSERVSFEPGPVWRIVMNRPEARNAVDARMLDALVSAFGAAAAEPDCRAVVLAGAGGNFCAGADLAELSTAQGGDAVDYVRTFEDILTAVEHQPQPVIAQVEGAALGAGCLLVLACDLAVATDDARLAVPSARLGVVVNFENIERLVMAVGPNRAADLLEASHEITGATAAGWGLVNRAVPARDLHEATLALARRVAARAPLAVKASKRGIHATLQHLALDRSLAGHTVADFDMMAAEAFASDDAAEGIAAVRERRRPEFRGR